MPINLLKRKYLSFPVISLSLLLLLLTLITISQPYNNSPPIRSDGIGYHIWVHAIKQRSVNFCEHKEILEPIGALSMVNKTKERCGNKYPPGVGIIQTPFTLPFVSKTSLQKYTATEHWIILSLGSLLLLGTILFSGYALQSLNCKHKIIISSTAAVTFGTGLLHYSTYDSSFSHIYSAFLFSATLWIAIKPQGKKKKLKLEISTYALICLLLILVRQTNLLLILSSSLILAKNQTIAQSNKLYYATTSILSTLAGIGFYIFYNHYHIGELTLSTYGQEKVIGFASHTLKVFLSYERGLLNYYPIVALTLAMGWIVRKKYNIYYTTITLVIVYGLIYGSWESWYLGGGFGHRGFVDMSPIIMIVLGMTYNQISTLKKQKFWETLMIILTILCIFVTTKTMHAYWISEFPFQGTDAALYWQTVNPLQKH